MVYYYDSWSCEKHVTELVALLGKLAVWNLFKSKSWKDYMFNTVIMKTIYYIR